MEAQPTLYVDLDGTLIVSDSLWESLILLVKNKPLAVLALPWWLRGGKAAAKEQIALRSLPPAEALPYNTQLLEYLQQQKSEGRRIVLATASNIRVAQAVSRHLGIFDAVIASDATRNLSGQRKLEAIRSDANGGEFDYFGNSSADLPLWQAARRAYVVSPRPGVMQRARSVCTPYRVFASPSPPLTWLKVMRPAQWVKNILVVIPFFLAHAYHQMAQLVPLVVAFFAMSLCASAIYLVNDLSDLASDRLHPRKRHRPLAAGTVSIPVAIALAVGLLLAGVGMAFTINQRFVEVLLAYLLATTAYSFYFKKRLLLDVVLLAGLYTLRLIAGSAAAGVFLSFWLLAFSMFLFASLAFVKRYSELSLMKDADRNEAHGRSYLTTDLELLASMGPTSGYMAVLVFALYINSPEVHGLYVQPKMLWLICPILLYWVSRIWFFARRRVLEDDPVLFAVRDRVSWICGSAALLLVMLAQPKPAEVPAVLPATRPATQVALPIVRQAAAGLLPSIPVVIDLTALSSG